MKPKNLILIPIVIVGLGLLPTAQAAPETALPNFNTADGQNALGSVTTGAANSAFGWFSLLSNTDASFNTGVGAGTLLFNNASNNTAVGAAALLFNTSGGNNTAVGAAALLNNTTGVGNTANGSRALQANTIGGANTAVGDSALGMNVSGTQNIGIGVAAGQNVVTASGVVCIGTAGADVSNSCFIGGIAGQTVGAGGTACFVDNDGKLGVLLSARRFKTDIADMGAGSEVLLALRPVTFRYKPELDKAGIPQFGLVAEEVAKVNPDLVTRDAKGDISTVRYEAINAMLLNEFLKEHRKVQEQEATIMQLKSTAASQQSAIAQQRKDFEATITVLRKEMETVAVRFKEQDAKIQSVSNQVQLSRLAAQMVANDQ